ncbi:hypothetical protein K1719_016376 [Acacia pycnantha]|nr:hypothetical protein K1719_016376 [Acacia pycnantha]
MRDGCQSEKVIGELDAFGVDCIEVDCTVRMEGGIPPLVELLEFDNVKVQIAAVSALRSLSLKNNVNTNQIVKCNALPTLVLMLGLEHPFIHSESVGVIANIVCSSPNIKRQVLLAGALQPVIGLLRFWLEDEMLWESSTFALGKLAQDKHNQVGIAFNGGIDPLLNLLCSKNGPIQHNAAFALYGMTMLEILSRLETIVWTFHISICKKHNKKIKGENAWMTGVETTVISYVF